MRLQRETVLKLGEIMKYEFNKDMDYGDLEKLAYSLVGYFDLLLKIENRHKFGNRPGGLIDSNNHKELDDNKEKE